MQSFCIIKWFIEHSVPQIWEFYIFPLTDFVPDLQGSYIMEINNHQKLIY